MTALDLFAGPGGWDEGVKSLGIEPLGIELDDAACATRSAAGHRTLQADVSELVTSEFRGVDLLLASPPCQSFSIAGRGAGRASMEDLSYRASAMSRGSYRLGGGDTAIDPGALLVLEPLRFALDLSPKWIAFEQVPSVLPLWEKYAEIFGGLGYSTWTGKVSAEEFGVAQVRKRAILLASRTGDVNAPKTGWRPFRRGGLTSLQDDLDGKPRWWTMWEELGWGMTRRPYFTLAGGTKGGPCYDFLGGSGARRTLLNERAEGHWVPAIDEDPDEQIVRLTFAEAGQLQSFPRAYPWRGTNTAKAVQIGNAIPPRLARELVSGLTS